RLLAVDDERRQIHDHGAQELCDARGDVRVGDALRNGDGVGHSGIPSFIFYPVNATLRQVFRKQAKASLSKLSLRASRVGAAPKHEGTRGITPQAIRRVS